MVAGEVEACQRAINAKGVSDRSDALGGVGAAVPTGHTAQLVIGEVEACQPACDKVRRNEDGVCCFEVLAGKVASFWSRFMPNSMMPFSVPIMASFLADSLSKLFPHTLHSVNEPVTVTMTATDFAPTGPKLVLRMLSDASLVSLLLWMASQTALTPSSLR